MFSKEWKLAALSLMTVVLATACGHDKKNKETSTPYQGVWVNARAYNLLIVRGAARDPRVCAVIAHDPCAKGLAQSFDGLALDSWEIRPNGQVFRHEPLPVQTQSRYRDQNWIGTMTGANFIPRAKSWGVYDDGAPGSCVTPFETGALSSNLEEGGMTVWGQRLKARYVRPNPTELQLMYSALAGCSVGPGAPNAELVPLPPGQGQGPAVGPQNFDYDGRDGHDRRPPRQSDK